jgi:uncharacterized DUF497 family protein
MIDLSSVSGFEWDQGNAYKSLDKHKISQGDSEEVFFNQPVYFFEDLQHSTSETRWIVLGVTNLGLELSIVFTLRKRNTLIRIISARPMSRKERVIYEKAKQKSDS